MSQRTTPLLRVAERDGATVAHLSDNRIVSEEDTRAMGAELERLAGPGGQARLVVDFTGVEALPSTALATLYGLKKRLGVGGGKLVLCGIGPDLAEVFRITRLDQIFTIASDEDAALALF